MLTRYLCLFCAARMQKKTVFFEKYSFFYIVSKWKMCPKLTEDPPYDVCRGVVLSILRARRGLPLLLGCRGPRALVLFKTPCGWQLAPSLAR
jgi:hypothetical protein